ncbi:hypothetical protein JM93_00610 [Roseibium hamelinense]|uniref:Uncharacterized protein n=1 Tax=Roseibium hamelinense TaxID=150831 RepID=A0A562TJ96_9HYPH|nr:hypothetical protein [Roseibium hamelinense]MTI45761.1 hypothetical protein [Roseibium hamelinense]TWI93056.1 hypothetical protein JM93_00610 [Roseibium hamelinense]
MRHTSNTLTRRILALPGQFLVALINATSILVIVAAVLVIVMLNRIETASETLAAAATEAALARMEIAPGDLKARLDGLEMRIETLTQALKNPDLPQAPALREDLNRLNNNLAQLNKSAQALSAAGPELTENALKQAGNSLTEIVLALSRCYSGTDQ